MKKVVIIVSSIIVSLFAIIGIGIGSYRVLTQARQDEMVRIASSHEARLLYEDWLKEYDAKYLTEEGAIKSYEVDLKHFRKNPMGGFYVRLYINHDENLKLTCLIDKRNNGELESTSASISPQLRKLLE